MNQPYLLYSPSSRTLPLPAGLLRRAGSRVRAYLALTKPTLQLLVVLTGAAALAVEGFLLTAPFRAALALTLLALSAGSAKALNQYLEREVDGRMERTRRRRPLPLGQVSPHGALVFALLLGSASVLGFWRWFTPAAALLTAGTILFYSFFYTLYLKPRTPYSIVIGGVAGGMGPVIAWAAAGASLLRPEPWLMLALVFLWTPPHFWSLALRYRDDYKEAGYPMLPTVRGEAAAWRAIRRYAWATALFSPAVAWMGGWIALLAAPLLGALLILRVIRAEKAGTPEAAGGVFAFSIVYLLAFFAAVGVGRVM